MYEKNMELIIPTWNRVKYLDRTPSHFSKSPFLEYNVTIIDYNSTDNTREIYKKYEKIFPQLKIIKNNKNIDRLTNILHCYEIPTSTYLWLVGDNDNYDFSNCFQIIDIIEKSDFDLIFVQDYDKFNLTTISTHELYEKGHCNHFIMIFSTITTFILKTELYTPKYIQEEYFMVKYGFPHFTFANKVSEENFSIYIFPFQMRPLMKTKMILLIH